VNGIIFQNGVLRLLTDISKKQNRPGLSASLHATLNAANTDKNIYSSLRMQDPNTVDKPLQRVVFAPVA
jgi:hypothetical protein